MAEPKKEIPTGVRRVRSNTEPGKNSFSGEDTRDLRTKFVDLPYELTAARRQIKLLSRENANLKREKHALVFLNDQLKTYGAIVDRYVPLEPSHPP